MKLDFFASQPHYLDHLLPIWEKFSDRGNFYITEEIAGYAASKISGTVIGCPKGYYPSIVSAYGDFVKINRTNPEAKVVLTEHGIGMTYNTPAYADGYGRRKDVACFLVQSEYVLRKFDPRIIAPRYVVGIPKLDKWVGEFQVRPIPDKPTIGISFHHSNFASIPEAQNVIEEYKSIFPKLSKQYKVLGTGHPLDFAGISEMYREFGIEVRENFDDIMREADILIFDCTSAGYEFLVTGKPVIVLNSPKFRRDQQFGIRFWDYSNIGQQVEKSEEVFDAIENLVEGHSNWDARKKAVTDLIPNIGKATDLAVNALNQFLSTLPDPSPVISVDDASDGGIIYMCFGERAKQEVLKSIQSLRELGMKYPICTVGDVPVEGTCFIEWGGESPFDENRPKGLQYLAGRIKPKLYRLSPFKKTLYLDADTRFRKNIKPGFDFLDTYDVAIAEENQSLKDLHNPNPGDINISWYHHMPEVEASIAELGNPDLRFLNSGVIFFGKCRAVEDLFDKWYEEWQVWQQWDEQFSFLRAFHKSARVNLKRLTIDWNCPRDKGQNIFIYHRYARGDARKD